MLWLLEIMQTAEHVQAPSYNCWSTLVKVTPRDHHSHHHSHHLSPLLSIFSIFSIFSISIFSIFHYLMSFSFSLLLSLPPSLPYPPSLSLPSSLSPSPPGPVCRWQVRGSSGNTHGTYVRYALTDTPLSGQIAL